MSVGQATGRTSFDPVLACPAGTRKAAGHATCTFCPAGSEPASSNYTACQLCASGHRSSEETAGLCLACGRGLQPTDLQFQHTMAGAARCSECVNGQHSEFDPRLQVRSPHPRITYGLPRTLMHSHHSSPVSSPHCPQVSHRCLACPEFMTTQAPGAEDVSNCACVAGRYDTVSHGIIWGHPHGFNDSTARDLMQASAGSIPAASAAPVARTARRLVGSFSSRATRPPRSWRRRRETGAVRLVCRRWSSLPATPSCPTQSP